MILFFDESRETSLVKAEIVAKYFWAWAKVIIPQAKKWGKDIAYIDLFSGPGRYQDGSKSTPLLILERAIADEDMRERLITIFNDKNSDNTDSLQQAINSLENIETLKYQPRIFNTEVGEEVVQAFQQISLVPTLFFIDPWGYKGISRELIGSVIKDWGCDCIFFFNYNRINMGLGNQAVEKHMKALFSEQRFNQLKKELKEMQPYERELNIIENISQELKNIGSGYVLPFCFKNVEGTRTSHHLIFISKHIRGYSIMKEIMAKESSSSEQGVPIFEYNPATKYQPLLFELSRPLDELENMLLNEFSGQTITMIDIYNQHHVGKRYIKKNYKDALIKLETKSQIIAEPSKRKKNTFGDKVKVIFPSKH
ncbi:MAG: three-Cys-motif partner protein TcmP [Okeania sp. SIO1H6]|nr:three-Cys-motif partner protein TcmP [Okeania sp. SIO1H4]NES90846.1 three-Cys-motif partner protein TcmP [Okeania sp. SIO2B9]NET13507.1 three-Cys-motif partner protein TcmP [Okeania sp. SIO1H6]NET22086.1 three-Cys-motif partner protein TcmP [Okeania sp. SIO1H5]NET95393.1 three-Cys-motif partner protein TcmP [Okeania sp. SIO1H2]RQH10352.1 three-Cys-motif partner protein TcmP [Okeania hirsuta]